MESLPNRPIAGLILVTLPPESLIVSMKEEKDLPSDQILRKPPWLKTRIPMGQQFSELSKLMQSNGLHTICQSGMCPNMAECWDAGTATLMILGDICTRSCRFCATKTGKPLPPDPEEPRKIAETVLKMDLKHVVITSVDRDDLPDFGAGIWAETIRLIRQMNPSTTIEVLIPDFMGRQDLIDIIAAEKPEVMSHNLETVERLTPMVRSKAQYQLSLNVIRLINDTGTVAKSGIMLGLGETEPEVHQVMDDLLNAGCSIITLGQYLQPTRNHLPVQKYYTPEAFSEFASVATEKGFRFVESAPLVRSSYHAEKHVC
jgi:lipoyl synthase